MINFDDVTKEDIKQNNLNEPEIPDYPYRIIVGGFGSWKTNLLLNLILQQVDIDKIYLYAKEPYDAKLPINKRKRKFVKRSKRGRK